MKPRKWVNNILLIGLLLTIITLFINWKTGLANLTVVTIVYRIAVWLGNEFSVQTIGEVANKMTRENYLQSRRNPKTVNREEIENNIRNLFSHELALNPSVLTREASLFN